MSNGSPVDPAPLEEHPEESAEDLVDNASKQRAKDMADDVLPEDATSDLSAADLDPATRNENFREATLQLLDGKITVPEWIDVAATVINDVVNIPYLPEIVEQKVFEYALDLVGKLLHGLLRGGTANSPTDG